MGMVFNHYLRKGLIKKIKSKEREGYIYKCKICGREHYWKNSITTHISQSHFMDKSKKYHKNIKCMLSKIRNNPNKYSVDVIKKYKPVLEELVILKTPIKFKKVSEIKEEILELLK